jgi:lysophospholipase L1-like esterase
MKVRRMAGFFDISNALDGAQYLLVDHAHVTNKGNRIIAEAIKQKICSL